MHKQRCTLPVFVLVLTVTILAACAPSEIPVNPEQTQIPESNTWQVPDEWWTKPQVQAFSAPLFEAYALDYQVNRPEYYLNIYYNAGVTLSNWNDFRGIDTWREVFPQVVEELHNRQYIVVGDIGMINYLMDQTAAQELQPAIMRDPYGNAIEENGCLPETPCNMSVLSVFHPASQNYYLSVVKTYIDAGVDGILIDELAFGSAFFPDFNENTMLEFRQYLQDIYSPEELITLGQPYGVTDFATMDYAALVRAELPAARTSLTRQDWQWELWSTLPFYLDYQRFLRLKHHEFALWLIEEGKAYAMEKRGREIPFSANLTEITGSEALYLIDALDYVDLEYHYKSLGYFPKARAVTSVRIAQGFGKQPYLVTGYWDTDPDIAARGIEKSTTLFQTMIAEGYGTGAPFAIMEGLHQIKQDFTALTSYYRFPRDYPYLFEGMTPEKGQVGLLYLWEAREYFNYADLRGLGQLLSDCGYQFNVIFGAEESTWWGRPKYIVPAPDHPLTLEALKANPLVIVPQLDDITPNHADILLQYVKQGGKLLIFSTSDLLGNIDWERGKSNPAVKELLNAINAGNVAIGEGKILAVKKLWGKTYTTDPQPTMQQPLIDLLTAEGLLPEVSMSTNNYVSAFMHQASDSLTVHFVNYDYNPDADTTKPASSRQVEITLPDGLVSGNPTIYLYSPDTAMQVLTGELTGNKLSLTLPEFDIWSVLWIGDKASLQTGIATHPTSTPLPTATSTPQLKPGYVIYNDSLTGGWQASPYDAEIDLNATTLVYQGSKAIELKALGWGALNLSYTEVVDTTGYDSLVLNVNPAGMDNLNISVTIFNQEKSVHYVYVADYLNGTTLRPNEWRTIVIPLNDLNPDGAAFNRIFISNESDKPASFYLDELFFTINKSQDKISTHPSSTPSPTAASTPSIEPSYTIYGDALSGGWQAIPFDAEININSTTLVSQGTKAIELNTLGWGALDLTFPEAVDTGGYDSLVLNVNPAEMENLNFSVTIFDQKKSVNYVFLADYIKGNPLLPNEWRTIVIPLSDLNPDGATFNRIFIQNESDKPASFYLDELFFAKVP